MAATIILCVLFYAFSDPEDRLCVFGNAFVAAESEQVQRESRRNRSPVGASRTRAPEGRLHRRVPEAATPARRREGAVSRFSAPPRQDCSQDHSTTRVPAASARHPEAKSVEGRRSARPSGAGERAPRLPARRCFHSFTFVKRPRLVLEDWALTMYASSVWQRRTKLFGQPVYQRLKVVATPRG